MAKGAEGIVKRERKRGGPAFYAVVDEYQDGKRRRRWHGPYPTEKAAKQARAALTVAQSKGTYVVPKKSLTVEEYLTKTWLPSMEARPKVRVTTYTNVESRCRTAIIPTIGEIPLQRLTGPDIDVMCGQLNKRLAASTVRLMVATLSHALNDAVDWGLLEWNPCRKLKALPDRDDTPKMTLWSMEQADLFLNSVANSRYYALWWLLVRIGVRRGEACGLQWSDLDLDAGTMTISRALVSSGVAPTIHGTKNGKPRTFSLDAQTVAVLRDHRRHQLGERLAATVWTDSGFLFVDEFGGTPTPNQITKWFKAAVQAAGLPDIRLHDLRHGSVTAGLRAGVPIHVLAARHGHDPAVMLRTYAHVTRDDDQDAADAIASAFSVDGQGLSGR
jgi:integrase